MKLAISITLLLFSIVFKVSGQSIDITISENGQRLSKKATYIPWQANGEELKVSRPSKKAKVGKSMIDFIGFDALGKSFDTKDFRDKYLVLEFSATWCSPCWIEYPLISKLQKVFPDIEFITFNFDENSKRWSQIAKRENIDVNWTILWDSERKIDVFQRYKARSFPSYFLISPDGIVIDSWLGSGLLLDRLISNNLLKIEDR